MKALSPLSEKIWVWIEPYKNINPFIKHSQGRKIVLPNQILIAVSTIIMAKTNGIDKNYIEIQCCGVIDRYYLDISLVTMCKKFQQFKRINKKQIINTNYVNGRLGNKYLFIDGIYFKVSIKYRDNIDFLNSLES